MRIMVLLIAMFFFVGISPAADKQYGIHRNLTVPTAYVRKGEGPSVEKHQNEIVFLLHGINRSAADMDQIQIQLRSRGYDTVNWDYPSIWYVIGNMAEDFAGVVKEQSIGKTKIHYVTHSMGGIVLRTMLEKHASALPSTGRIVMIGAPNNGAHMADVLASYDAYKSFFGPAGQQLKTGKAGGCATTEIPKGEIGIIAGGLGSYPGFNPLIREDNDGAVGVSETIIPQMTDYLLVPCMHRFLPYTRRSVDATVNFIETGKFLQQSAGQ